MIEIKEGHKLPLPAPIQGGKARAFLQRITFKRDLYLLSQHINDCAATAMAQVRAASSRDPEIKKDGSRFRYWVSKKETRECGRDEAIFLWLYIEYRDDEWHIVDATNEKTRIEPGYGKRFEFLNTGRREEDVY
ncbi:hypothetical protein ELG63_36515 [Rhizobium leguminosarum]|uniref:hypothetical protein n=1 Tax=Rhizobium leguminosarum TaxID=384 RepID=UPI001031CC1D|nr:hypothetical protein [Rhizobium leguminosarum]TBH28194.1 hypothetical protein ELG63_36515 [Rhizobium leguminosarum]